MDKFQNKYRIPSARHQNWDYRWDGAYFITICTKDRQHYFGKIENGKMFLSNVGILADVFWHEIINHNKNVELGEFVVMPNHVHGILILNDNEIVNNNETVADDGNGVGNVETGHALSLPHALSLRLNEPLNEPLNKPSVVKSNEQTIGQQRFQNIGKNSISSIIGSYKSAVTKHAHRLGFEFGWQTRFHDHIIRDDASFETITNYILNNPENWQEDKFFNK